ncbi:hypothetical protein GWK26_11925 [haloarchaeon 3A1-DGR]|nr:hypothetical protein GWK26_11925 [haloarchaeon 3A1-DGR]
MFRIDVECGGCGHVHEIRVDASGFTAGIPMRCPACERSEPHAPVSELRNPDDSSELETALGEVDDDVQAAQSAAYGGER